MTPNCRVHKRMLCVSAFLSALSVFSIERAFAQQSVAEFYKGKQIRFIIRSEPGGGYDLISRLIAAHISRHIPGNPSVIPQNMPGAGGVQAINYVGMIAPHDGTVLTLIGQGLPMDQSLGFTASFKADLRKFGWIGNVVDSNVLVYTWHSSPAKTIEEAKKHETLMGGTGAGSASTWIPVVLNNVVGTRFKVINGYRSATDVKLAMERGEIEGYGSGDWRALISSSPELFEKRLVSIIVQIGIRKEKELPDVPLLTDLAADTEGKAILEFVSRGLAAGRPVCTTPDVPPERLNVLRKAFDDTMADPEFVADARKKGIAVNPLKGIEVEDLINKIASVDRATLESVRSAMSVGAAR